MVKFYLDLERGEAASKTRRAHIPPRLFKDAVHLGKLQELEELKELIENIPDEILDTYKNKEKWRKNKEIAYE